MSLHTTMLLFLALQSMITLASAEVAFRYSRWYLATAKSEKLSLRPLILGIAITHWALFANGVLWVLEQARHGGILPNGDAMLGSYQVSLPLKAALFIGITVHLLPVWRIVKRFSYGAILASILLRAGISVLLIAVALNRLG